MSYANFIRGIVKKHPDLKNKLKKAANKQTTFQYTNQAVMMTIMSTLFFATVVFLVFKSEILKLLIAEVIVIVATPLYFRFWFGYVDVLVKKAGRELDGDLLFVSEYFLVSMESGLPLGNAIQRISRLNRPGGYFFKRVYMDFKTGKDLEESIGDAAEYAPSESTKILLKRLKDSLNIGIDLKSVLENFIEESSEKKILEIRSFGKKLNPIVMMYLLMGIVVPSLGITFFILGAAILEITPELLKWILVFLFLIMFAFQYLAYSMFKFSKSTI
ncbi:MAG: type II secretion system F family protein [Nanoarchaeota archaeon]